MKQKIYLIAATPGSGKTWVCEQLKDNFTHVPHDEYMKQKGNAYMDAIMSKAIMSSKPILAETPFSVSKFTEYLPSKGFQLEVVFIVESEEVTADRYLKRTGQEILEGHLSRIRTYKERAKELKAFSGTSEQVLEYLKRLAS
jgi:hypothetical protein